MILSLILLCGQLTVSPEIKGPVSGFIPVTAVTEGKAVKYVPLDAGLQVFPPGLLVNPKSTVVVAAKSGRYRLLCYSSVGDIPTDPVITTIVVGDQSPVPPPTPPDNELTESLSGIYGGLQDPAKAQKLLQYIDCYRRCVPVVRDTTLTTTEKLYQVLLAQRKASGLQDNDLLPLRQRIGTEWTRLLGTNDVPVTAQHRSDCAALIQNIITALESLR
jgi:hypothetical protein